MIYCAKWKLIFVRNHANTYDSNEISLLGYNSVQYADYQNINNPQNCLFSNLGEGFGNLTDDFHIYACGMALLAKLGDGFAIRDAGSQSALVIVRQE